MHLQLQLMTNAQLYVLIHFLPLPIHGDPLSILFPPMDRLLSLSTAPLFWNSEYKQYEYNFHPFTVNLPHHFSKMLSAPSFHNLSLFNLCITFILFFHSSPFILVLFNFLGICAVSIPLLPPSHSLPHHSHQIMLTISFSSHTKTR